MKLFRKVINVNFIRIEVNMNYIRMIKDWVPIFLKQHGIVMMLKGIILYHYRILKLLKIDISKEQIVVTNNCSIILIPHDKGISTELLLYGTHEPLSTKALKNELKEGMTCLDIGANIGYYATIESKIVGKSGRVIAIEPSPITFSYLKRNMELQKISNYEVHNFAMGDMEGEVNFLSHHKSNLSMVFQKGQSIPPGCELTTVHAITVDKFVEEKKLKNLDLIRMDVEGYEFEILNSAKKTITKYEPMIQLELHKFILGSKKLKKILLDFKNFGYTVKCCVERDLDIRFLGTNKDVRTDTLEQLIKEVDENIIPMTFVLLLKKERY